MGYERAELIEALRDGRVLNALVIALRDAQIRRRFLQLRREMTVAETVERLANEFHLSEERVRTIVYRKGE